MQKLYVMRGPQGSGKSSFLREHGLQPYTVCLDEIKKLYASTEMFPNGMMGISARKNDHVIFRFKEILDVRMAEGLTTFIDAMHANKSDIDGYQDLAKRWGYEIRVIDFYGKYSDQELKARVEHRSANEPDNYMPLTALARSLEQFRSASIEGYTVITPEQALTELDMNVINKTPDFKKILFIGDIQGCATPLSALLDKHYSDDTNVIFVGDLFDRGPENSLVMLIMKELIQKPNVELICGNHERHLRSWLNKIPTPREFSEVTLPDLLRHGFNPEIAQAFLNKAQNLMHFQFGEKLFQVLHGGASGLIKRPGLFPGAQCWKGVGHYEFDVDKAFEMNADKAWCQVHGHRNYFSRDLLPQQRSFTLECNVEHGGSLRALSFDGEHFEPIHIQNRVFVPISQRDVRSTHLPEWIINMKDNNLPIEEEKQSLFISEQQLAELRNHELIREMVQDGMSHVSSFNFTREAFFSKSYDSCNSTARGLFVNTHTREIVVRGYDKYFNIGEKGIPQASLENIMGTSKPPYTTTIKENGSLGLLGYDAQTDSLVFASKSSISSDHASWLKERITQKLNTTQLEELKILLRDYQISMAFELIEPQRDPHIIEYKEPKVVLLDCIRRSMKFEKMEYAKMSQIAMRFGLDHKQEGPVFTNKTGFFHFLSSISSNDKKFNNQFVEGLVCEDANGKMLKIKLPYYNLWKFARSAANAVVRHKEKGTPVKPHYLQEDVVKVFVDWLMDKDIEFAKQDIITLRKAFLEQYPEYTDAIAKSFQIERKKIRSQLDSLEIS